MQTLTNPTQLWDKALDELQGQMTRPMFDTWLAGTCASEDRSNGRLVIACKSAYAVEWLDNRLRATIERTVAYLHGGPIDIAFTVATTQGPHPKPAPMEIAESTPAPEASEPHPAPSFDTLSAGYTAIANYALRFWAPFLATQNRHAFRVWEIVRETDRRRTKDVWTPAKRYTVPELCATIPCSRQALMGVNRRANEGQPGAQYLGIQTVDQSTGEIVTENGWYIHQDGALDVLQREGVAQIERRGERSRAIYRISVLVRFPLLHPSQAAFLPASVQVAHDAWLNEHSLEPDDWQ